MAEGLASNILIYSPPHTSSCQLSKWEMNKLVRSTDEKWMVLIYMLIHFDHGKK